MGKHPEAEFFRFLSLRTIGWPLLMLSIQAPPSKSKSSFALRRAKKVLLAIAAAVLFLAFYLWLALNHPMLVPI